VQTYTNLFAFDTGHSYFFTLNMALLAPVHNTQ